MDSGCVPLGRRFPLYARPLPAAASLLAIILGVIYGPNWNWDWALQTGNIFIVITVPTTLLVFTGLNLVFLILLVLGLAGFIVFGRVPKDAAAVAATRHQRGIWAPKMRFYPMLFFFGLFLAYFGTAFLFKASVSGAEGGVGLAAFIYLNYDGIFNRGFISLFGAMLLAIGLYMTVFMSWQPGLGFDVKPLSRVITREPEAEDEWQTVEPSRRAPPPAPRPVRAAPVAPTTTRAVRAAPATPPRAPSAGRPSSASRPVRSPASPAPPARTATTSKRPSTGSSRAAAGTAPP